MDHFDADDLPEGPIAADLRAPAVDLDALLDAHHRERRLREMRTDYREGTGAHIAVKRGPGAKEEHGTCFSLCEDCGWWSIWTYATGPRGGAYGSHTVQSCRCGLESR